MNKIENIEKINPSFGNILKKLREERKDEANTQGDYAKLLKVGLRQYQRYEKGLVPDIDKLIELCKLLNYDFFSHVTDGLCTLAEKAENRSNPPGLQIIIKYQSGKEVNLSDVLEKIEENNAVLHALSVKLLPQPRKPGGGNIVVSDYRGDDTEDT